MSSHALSWVWRYSRSTNGQRLVMVAIADRANDEGYDCKFSIATISKRTQLHRATVMRAIQQLEELGELRVERAFGRASHYVMTFPAYESEVQEPVASVDPSQNATGSTGPQGGPHSDARPVANSNQSQNATSRNLQPDPSQDATATGRNLRHKTNTRSLSLHAREDAEPEVSMPPLIGRGEAAQFGEGMRKHHAKCHPEVCNWKNALVSTCMPMALVDEYARKLTHRMSLPDALAWVVEKARTDTPPADYVAPGSVYAHWGLRWDAWHADVAQPRQNSSQQPFPVSSVPSADETRQRYLEKRA